MLKVLFVAAEAVPFAKTGGLADVAGSLPQELRAQGVDIRLMMPKYSVIAQEYKTRMERVCAVDVELSWRRQYCGVDQLVHNEVPVYFIDNEQYFKRDRLYGEFDDAERFAFFCKAVLTVLPHIDFWPDIIHFNDWHTGLISVFLTLGFRHGDERYRRIKTVYTIHNLKYQGSFGKEILGDVLGIDWQYYQDGSVEVGGDVNFLKSGLIFADSLTTVSETYAQEIQYEYFGEKLDAVLRWRSGELTGIVNGIDYREYNPAADDNIAVNYTMDTLNLKTDNKVALQHRLDLPERRDVPLLAMVTRLVAAKGLDLLQHIIDELLYQEDIQIVILGAGDKQYEEFVQALAWRHPRKVSANVYFDNQLAHQIYAAADLFLMPSQYEPCGIGQLIALRYGAVPVVRETGGLKDTVIPYNKYEGTGNGFTFYNYNAHEFLFAIKTALSYYTDKLLWNNIMRNGMQDDHSWRMSAARYQQLYQRLIR